MHCDDSLFCVDLESRLAILECGRFVWRSEFIFEHHQETEENQQSILWNIQSRANAINC